MKKYFALLVIVLVVPFLAFKPQPNNRFFEISKNIEIFSSLYKELNLGYVDDLDPAQFMRVGIDAMLTQLDPFTNYISESQIESYRVNAESRFEGLGAELKSIDNYVTIYDLYENSPAQKSGLAIGDQIISVEGKSAQGKSPDEVRSFLKGSSGSAVKMSILRPGESKTIELQLVRGENEIKNVPFYTLLEGQYAYIVLSVFTENASANIASAYRKILQQYQVGAPNGDLKGIILDLRDNGGGLLREAISVSNLFIPKGELVVTTKGKVKEWDRTYNTPATPLDTDIPVSILVDKYTASASEIVSGVVQDYDRGIIIGQRSYGKGLVQNTKDIGYNSQLKLTTAKYYIPSGRCIQGVAYENGEPKDIPDNQRTVFKTRNGRPVLDGGGITPDIKVPLPLQSPLIKQLLAQDLVFKFVNEHLLKNKQNYSAEQIKFAHYDLFKAYAVAQKFMYKSPAQDHLEALKKSQEDQTYTYSETTKQLFNSLEKQIIAEDEQLWQKDQGQLTSLIEKEIAKRLLNEEQKIQYRLLHDVEVVEALGILKDQKTYSSLLARK